MPPLTACTLHLTITIKCILKFVTLLYTQCWASDLWAFCDLELKGVASSSSFSSTSLLLSATE